MARPTPDLCDDHPGDARAAAPLLRPFGGPAAFAGRVATVKVHEDNVLVRAALAEPGDGRVLVVDGGGSLRCALVGGKLAALGTENGWRGALVYGCVRDVGELRATPFGVLALAAHPVKSAKKGEGERDVPVTFADVTFRPGDYVYVDEDGVVVSGRPLD
jgi:regulator of ribonuclease activity A